MKEKILNGLKGIALVNALAQLALSQIHIEAITKLFVKEIGFYLFFFTIFGLVTAFNVFLLDKYRGIIFFMISSWVTAGVGYVYLNLMQADVLVQEMLTMSDVQQSWYLVIVAIAIFLVSSVLVPVFSWGQAEWK
jgi:hypothetical protein